MPIQQTSSKDVTSLAGQELELMCKAKQYQQGIVKLASKHSLGSWRPTLGDKLDSFLLQSYPGREVLGGCEITHKPLAERLGVEFYPVSEKVNSLQLELQEEGSDFVYALNNALEGVPLWDYVVLLGTFNDNLGNDGIIQRDTTSSLI